MGKKILIVDDEPDILKPFLFRLKKQGYEVTSASDGTQALESVKRENPDLILLDVKLPMFDGYAVCRQLKADENLKMIPVLLVTADAHIQIESEWEKAGAEGYLLKPFDPEELLNKIKGCIS